MFTHHRDEALDNGTSTSGIFAIRKLEYEYQCKTSMFLYTEPGLAVHYIFVILSCYIQTIIDAETLPSFLISMCL